MVMVLINISSLFMPKFFLGIGHRRLNDFGDVLAASGA